MGAASTLAAHVGSCGWAARAARREHSVDAESRWAAGRIERGRGARRQSPADVRAARCASPAVWSATYSCRSVNQSRHPGSA
eukprot:4981976-Prymnesium_polylepis.1